MATGRAPMQPVSRAAASPPAGTAAVAAFDLGPFWKELAEMLKFVKGRLEYGQTGVEGAKMDDHIQNLYITLRNQILSSEQQAREQPSRLPFWEDCKEALDLVLDRQTRKPRGSLDFQDLYPCLYRLQMLALAKPDDFWVSCKKPRRAVFEEVVHVGDRSNIPTPQQGSKGKGGKGKSGKSAQTVSVKGTGKNGAQTVSVKGTGKNGTGKGRSRSPRRGKGKPGGKGGKSPQGGKSPPSAVLDPAMGPNGIWQWRNPPRPLHEGKGFWIFYKQAYWVCDTPTDLGELDRFEPVPKHAEGCFTKWIHEKYARQHPFLTNYDPKPGGSQYGLLNRLDRETSGPVVVVKDEESFKKIKKLRDIHAWHKEYYCLVHGRIPPEHWEGVLENWMLTKRFYGAKTSQKTEVVDSWQKGDAGDMCKKAITLYQVEGYYSGLDQKGGNSARYTLVKVRIVTGLTHQIRVHMSYLLRTLQVEGGEYGLVSDFLYLSKEASKFDKDNVCERVFLHEQMFGMWDPENPSKALYVLAKLPEELQACMKKLTEDRQSAEELAQLKRRRRNEDPVEAFAQKFRIGPQEKKELREGYTWKGWPEGRKHLMSAFAEKCGDGLPSLSMNGDHSFLFEGIRKDVEESMSSGRWHKWWTIIDEILDRHITEKLEEQDRQVAAREVANASEPLPPGWRRMERGDTVFYLHESGHVERHRPVPDPDLPAGWVKLASRSRPGEYMYYSSQTGQTLARPPTPDDNLPAGWTKRRSRSDPDRVYYVHRETDTVQFGFPCEGPPEDLPPDWERVASLRSGSQPYYFNRVTGETRQPPEDLPPGWKEMKSSQGLTYYFNQRLVLSQYEKPVTASH